MSEPTKTTLEITPEIEKLLQERIAKIFAMKTERDLLLAKVQALNKELLPYELAPYAVSLKNLSGLERLKGDKKDKLKPIITAVVAEHRKDGIARAEIESDARVTDYLKSVNFTGKLNLLSILSDMCDKDKSIKSSGKKSTMKYLPV